MRLIAAFLACLLAAPAAAEDSPLERLSTGDAGRAWEAVGRLDVGGESFCTAALVAPDLVLTAAHCLFATGTGRQMDLGGIKFLAGWRDGRASAYRGIRQVAIHPGYDPMAREPREVVPSDVALLRLDAPIRSTRILPFEVAAPSRDVALGVVSYAAGRAEAPSIQRSCELIARHGSMFVTSCEAEFGASGAPIFDFASGRPRIVSVVSAKARSGGRPVALGADAGAALPQLAAMLGTAGGVFAREPAGIAIRRVGEVDGRETTGAKFLKP